MNVLAGLEGLDAHDRELGDVTSADMMVELMEGMEAVASAEAEVDEMMRVEEGATASIENLQNIVAVIEEYGISRSMMEAVDPSKSLVSAGLVTAYEELSDTPVKDTNAVAAIEGVGKTIKSAMKKIWEFIKNMWTKLKVLFNRMFDVFKSYHKILVELEKKLKNITIDDEKAKKAEYSRFKSMTTVEAGTIIVTIVNEAVSKTKNILSTDDIDALKKLTKDLDAAIETHTKHDLSDMTDEQVSKLKVPEVLNNINGSLSVLAAAKNVSLMVKSFDKLVADIGKAAKTSSTDEAVLKEAKEITEAKRDVFKSATKLCKVSLSMANKVIKQVVREGRALVSVAK